jgi:hypothetical protein
MRCGMGCALTPNRGAMDSQQALSAVRRVADGVHVTACHTTAICTMDVVAGRELPSVDGQRGHVHGPWPNPKAAPPRVRGTITCILGDDAAHAQQHSALHRRGASTVTSPTFARRQLHVRSPTTSKHRLASAPTRRLRRSQNEHVLAVGPFAAAADSCVAAAWRE